MKRYNFRATALAAVIGLGLVAATDASAQSVELQQTGFLHTGDYLDNYYIGGYAGDSYTSGALTGQSAYGPGPNLGFTFSANAEVLSSGTNAGKFENLPTGDLDGNTQVLYFSSQGSSVTDTINFAGGFRGVSFNYSLDNNSSSYNLTADIWSGANGGGTLLGTISLGANATTTACSTHTDAYCTWSSASFSNLPAAAQSITFGASNGNAAQVELDAVTVASVPEPGTWGLMAAGMLAVVSCVRLRRSA